MCRKNNISIKLGSIDNNENASFCLCRQVWTVALVTIQPISDDIKSSRRCRQVWTVPSQHQIQQWVMGSFKKNLHDHHFFLSYYYKNRRRPWLTWVTLSLYPLLIRLLERVGITHQQWKLRTCHHGCAKSSGSWTGNGWKNEINLNLGKCERIVIAILPLLTLTFL